MRVPIDTVGEHGIIKDILPNQLEPNAWSDGNNVQMRGGAVHSVNGYDEHLGTPTVSPTYIINNEDYWVYGGATAIYSCDDDGTNHTDRSNGTYTSGDWNGTVLGSIPIFTNNTEVPQAWISGANFVDLTNWPASTTCKLIRTFGSYLIALDITEAGTRNEKLVRWSHPADAGSVPSSWDYTADTNRSGRTELSEAAGDIKDGLTLGGEFLIYTEGSVWRMVPVTNKYVFQIQKVFGDFGVIAENCVADIGGRHAVFSNGDIFIHDGYKKQSIIHSSLKEWLFQQIDPDNKGNCFVVANNNKSEVMFCYPELGYTYPNKAFVWNWRTNETGLSDLPDLIYATSGKVIGSADTWDGDSNTWDSDTTQWNELVTSATGQSIVGVAANKLYTLDVGNSANGLDMVSFVAKEDTMISPGVNMLTAIRPKVVSSGTPINIYVSRKFNLEASPKWYGPYTFDPDTQRKVDLRISGRYFGFRFRYVGKLKWKLSSYELEYQPAGDR
ncbi:MAG: hypothetical protein AB2792_19865 [Candidatus Thiodiazotropha sp.]